MHWLGGYNWTGITLNTAGTHKLALSWITRICRYVHTHELSEKHLLYPKKGLKHKHFCLACGTSQTSFLKIVFQCCQQIISIWNFCDYFQQQRLLALLRGNSLLKSMVFCCTNSLYYIATMFSCCFIYKRLNLETSDINMTWNYQQRGRAMLELIANKPLHWQFCKLAVSLLVFWWGKPKPNSKTNKQKPFSCCII